MNKIVPWFPRIGIAIALIAGWKVHLSEDGVFAVFFGFTGGLTAGVGFWLRDMQRRLEEEP